MQAKGGRTSCPRIGTRLFGSTVNVVMKKCPPNPLRVSFYLSTYTLIQLDCRSATHTRKINLPANRKGYIRHCRDHHWKALVEENLDLTGLFFSDHFWPLNF